MNVVLFAGRRLISQPGGDLFYDVYQGCFRCPVPIRLRALLQKKTGRQTGSSPSAEIFRRKLCAADLAQILVHVARLNTLRLPVLIEIFEKRTSRNIFTSPHNTRQPWILKPDLVMLSAFAPETKLQSVAQNLYVLVPERRQTE
jgi:hypothetical protein